MEFDVFIVAFRNRPLQYEQVYGCTRWRPASGGRNTGTNSTSIFDYLERFGVGIKFEPHGQDRRKPAIAEGRQGR